VALTGARESNAGEISGRVGDRQMLALLGPSSNLQSLIVEDLHRVGTLV
jgi:hypothetical protein